MLYFASFLAIKSVIVSGLNAKKLQACYGVILHIPFGI